MDDTPLCLCAHPHAIPRCLNYFLKPIQKLSPPAFLSRSVEVTALYGSSASLPERKAARGRNKWGKTARKIYQRGFGCIFLGWPSCLNKRWRLGRERMMNRRWRDKFLILFNQACWKTLLQEIWAGNSFSSLIMLWWQHKCSQDYVQRQFSFVWMRNYIYEPYWGHIYVQG